MLRRMAVPLALACVLAGCTQAPEAAPPLPDDPSAFVVGGRDLRTGLTAEDELGPPQWVVGDHFGHHVFFGAGDNEGTHYETVVVAADATGWTLAGTNRDIAITEAVFDIPILGHVRRDLSTTSFGGEWQVYSFPLRDGKTWATSLMTFDANGQVFPVEVRFTATYNPSIVTAKGNRPGFDIVGITDDGPLLETNYVPAIGWYTEMKWYDLSTEAPDDLVLRSISMGTGTGWTGDYHVITAAPLIEHFTLLAPDPSAVQPNPQATFTVAEGTTTVWGFAFAYAANGVQGMAMVDPQHGHHEFYAVGTEQESSVSIDLPAIAGEWRILSPGIGMVAVGGVFLWGLTEGLATL